MMLSMVELYKEFPYCSEAILKYLTTKPNVPKHWYPTAPRQRANVDEFISWHHLGLRGPCIALIREAVSISS